MKKKHLALILIIALIFLLGIFLGTYFSQDKFKKTQSNSYNLLQGTIIKEMPIVGVDSNGNGVAGTLSVEVKPGNGLVLVNINDVFADYQTQLSARTAASVASNYTNINLLNLDVIYNIKANANVVEGPSAGVVMAVAVIAALENKTIKPNIYITGAISPDGSVSNVGGIIEKAKAAAQNHVSLFIIPTDNYVTGYNEQKACTNLINVTYCEIKYVQNELNLDKYLGVNVQQVKNINETVGYALE